MAKIWITRKELGRLVREEFPDDDWGAAVPDEHADRPPGRQRPPPFERHPQSMSLEPDPDTTQTIRARSANPRVGRDPEKRQAQIGVARGGGQHNRLVPTGKRDPSARQPYTRDELSHGADVEEPSEVEPASGGMPNVKVARGTGSRSRIIPTTGGRDPSARQPYSRDELRQGADVDDQHTTGVLDRLKKIFLRNKGK